MMAHIYLAFMDDYWRPCLTIAPEVDKLYWHDGANKERYAGFEQKGHRKAAAAVCFWRSPLPLGEAARAVLMLKEKLGRRQASRTEAFAALAGCVKSLDSGKHASSLEPQGQQAEWWVCEQGLAAGDLRNGLREAYVSGSLLAKAMQAAELLEGRALLRSEAQALLGAMGPEAAAAARELLQLAALIGRVRLRGAVAADSARQGAPWRRRRERSGSGIAGSAGCLRCLRCGSGEAQLRRTPCEACGRLCAYCANCIALGRSRECELLVLGQRAPGLDAAGGRLLPAAGRLERWALSPAQAAAAEEALRYVESPSGQAGRAANSSKYWLTSVTEWLTAASGVKRTAIRRTAQRPEAGFLLWAVTGAGKTEMVFPLLESVLLRGGRALLATPRRDVVIELDLRIRKAFPQASVVTLYGGSEQRWERGEITLSTTHQLIRFHEAFDLVIIDELDAFPYVGDPMLHYAANKSVAPNGAKVLLSATPPAELQREARRGRLPHAKVPVRYHRHPLPVPVLLQTATVAGMLYNKRLPASLVKAIQRSLQRGAQLFVFVQRIAQTEPMAELLRSCFPQHSSIMATSSQDPDRASKVQRFRQCEIRLLVTTTILERGVTIPRSDVFIMDADGGLFDEASLVQMAGRAGRSADDPFGHVYFCSKERNRAQLAAVSHIRNMNKLARKHGYLHAPAKGRRG